jgi:hypothetical protein
MAARSSTIDERAAAGFAIAHGAARAATAMRWMALSAPKRFHQPLFTALQLGAADDMEPQPAGRIGAVEGMKRCVQRAITPRPWATRFTGRDAALGSAHRDDGQRSIRRGAIGTGEAQPRDRPVRQPDADDALYHSTPQERSRHSASPIEKIEPPARRAEP